MKRSLLLIAILLTTLPSIAKKANGNIDFISPGIYQLVYPGQLIHIYFAPDNLSQHQGLFAPADLSESQRYEVVKIIGQQIDLLPQDIIETYLRIEIVPGHIYDEDVFGFSHYNQMIIDVVKTKAGMSHYESITTALAHEIGTMIFQQHSRSNATMELKAYLNEFYLDHYHLLRQGGSIYQYGFVSSEAAGTARNGYSVTNEMAELFAHMVCPESNDRISEYIKGDIESILREKLAKFNLYIQSVSPAFDNEYKIGSTQIVEKIAPENFQNFYADDMLAMHELKSNETFDFSIANELPELQASTYTIPSYEDNFEDVYPEHNLVIPETREEQIEAFFNGSNDKKSKKQSKKTKKRKNGSGLLLVGSLIYLTLQLLSQ